MRRNIFNSRKNILLSASFALCFVSANVAANTYKHVAVAPQDVEQQRLPAPNKKGVFSHSTMLPVYSKEARQVSNLRSGEMTITKSIMFDGIGDSPIVFLGPQSDQWQMSIIDPNGRKVFDESSAANKRLNTESIKVGNQSFKGKKHLLKSPAAGNWQISLTRKGTQSKTSKNENLLNNSSFKKSANVSLPLSNKGLQSVANDQLKPVLTKPPVSNLSADLPIGYLLFKGDPDYKAYSYIDSHFTTKGNNINLVAYLIDSKNIIGERKLQQERKALVGNIGRAFALVTSPSNKPIKVLLRDDGTNGDKIAGDGHFSAKLPTDETGVYTTELQIEGIRPDGSAFSRTVIDLYPIVEKSVSFSKESAQLITSKNNQSVIRIPVRQHKQTNRLYVSAEIWGASGKGLTKAATWVGGIVEPQSKSDSSFLEIQVDERWLTTQGLNAPFQLKNLTLQTVEENVPLQRIASMPLLTDKAFNNKLALQSLSANNFSISQDMLSSAVESKYKTNLDSKQQIYASGNKLLLVHGYCSSSVWNTSQFSNSVEFKDYDKNRSHDEFARLIRDFGSQYDSFGVVAHSQGGAAALQLYTKYWSGLDYASGGRLIQSVGTPYQGTALAGNAAVLGQIFGVGCGKNTDLTYSGAANWLSTVPSWARSQVDYYTTSFKTRWWAWDYCNIVTDLLLDDPEDGTTEKWSGQLSGAVNKGHKKGWCHTRSMRDPAQFLDSGRNSSMSSRAAR